MSLNKTLNNLLVQGKAKLPDNIKAFFGTGDDWSLRYDATAGEFILEDESSSVNAIRIPDGQTLSAVLENGGVHELDVSGLSGDLATEQDPKPHAVEHENGGVDELSVQGLSGDLADAQDPKAHASSHSNGGSDEITVENLGTAGSSGSIPTSNGVGGLTMEPPSSSNLPGWSVPYPLSSGVRGTTVGGGSVSFTTSNIEFREPGNASATSESRAFDPVYSFAPSAAGNIRIDLSNITIDNDNLARIILLITDSPDESGFQPGSNNLAALASGSGNIFAGSESAGSSGSSVDSTQDNAFVSALNYLDLQWDGSSVTVEASDGTTTVTVSESTNYPSGVPLFVKVAAEDADSGAARNVDFDVTGLYSR